MAAGGRVNLYIAPSGNRREEIRERTLSDRQQKILEVVGRKMETAHLVTRGQIFSWIGGKKELVYEAIDRLVEAGRLEAHIIGREHFHPNLKGPTPEIYLPSGVDPALYLASRGTGNQWEPVEDRRGKPPARNRRSRFGLGCSSGADFQGFFPGC